MWMWMRGHERSRAASASPHAISHPGATIPNFNVNQLIVLFFCFQLSANGVKFYSIQNTFVESIFVL